MEGRSFKTVTLPNDFPHLPAYEPTKVECRYDPEFGKFDVTISRLSHEDGRILEQYSPGMISEPDEIFRMLTEDWAIEYPDDWAIKVRADYSASKSTPFSAGGSSSYGIYHPEGLELNEEIFQPEAENA